MTNTEYTVETIETTERFKELQGDWERLYNSKKEIPIFFSYPVFKILFETLRNNFTKLKISVLVVRNKNRKTVAILPFTLETRTKYFLPIKELSIKGFFLIGFYFFLFESEENPELLFQKIIEHLKKEEKKWDLIKFYSIPEVEMLYDACRSAFTQHYKTKHFETDTLVINCEGGFQEYTKSEMSKSTVKNIKRKLRRLGDQGELRFVELKEEHEMKKGLQQFYEVEDRNWKGRMGTSLKRAWYGEFYEKMAFFFSKENKVRLYLLQLDDRSIAGLYTLIDRGTCYVLKSGYDEAFSKYSPSTGLEYMFMEKHFRDNEVKTIDWYGPFHQYEQSWGKQTRKKSHFVVYNNKLLPFLYYHAEKRIVKRGQYS